MVQRKLKRFENKFSKYANGDELGEDTTALIVSLAGFNLAMAVRPFNKIGCKFSLKYSIASVELGYGSKITTIKYNVENKTMVERWEKQKRRAWL